MFFCFILIESRKLLIRSRSYKVEKLPFGKGTASSQTTSTLFERKAPEFLPMRSWRGLWTAAKNHFIGLYPK